MIFRVPLKKETALELIVTIGSLRQDDSNPLELFRQDEEVL